MDRAVVEALLHRGLDQAVLIEAREALELGGRDRRPQVVTGAGLVDTSTVAPGSAASIIRSISARSAATARLYGQAPRRIVPWNGRTSTSLPGRSAAPPGSTAPSSANTPAPCVVMASGFSCVRDQGLDGFAERFAAAGFAVLAFDYRYFADSSGRAASAGPGRPPARRLARGARPTCVRSTWIDDRRIALWGFSAGGGHVQSLALTEPGSAQRSASRPLVDGSAHPALHRRSPPPDPPRARRRSATGCAPCAAPGPTAYLLRDRLAPVRSSAAPNGLRGFESITPPGSSWRNEACARTFLAPPYRLARKTRRIPIPILYCITEGDDVAPPALGKHGRRAGALRASYGPTAGGHFDAFLGADPGAHHRRPARLPRSSSDR